jgi:hypothetical protein
MLAKSCADLVHKMTAGTKQSARQRAQMNTILAALPVHYRQQLLDGLVEGREPAAIEAGDDEE